MQLTPTTVPIAYETTGDEGTPVVLIMGFSAPRRSWVNQVPALSEHHRVAIFDNRGVGDSAAPKGPYAMADFVADTLGLIDHLGWERVHLVGVSMGGMIAQNFALAHRSRLLSLSLLATHHGGLRSRLPTLRGMRLFLESSLRRHPERRLHTLERLLYPESYLAVADRAIIRSALADQFGDPPPTRARLAQLAAVARHDTRRRLAELHGLPTLIVKPTDDVLVKPTESERLHKHIPGSTLLVLHDTGHGLIRQRPAELNAALLQHFASAEDKR